MELLAPAGDFVKLKTALHYGADAVYFAGKKFGLRTFAGNFDDAELKSAVDYVHSLGKTAYVTVNILPRSEMIADIVEYCRYLHSIQVDAIIAADIGVISAVHEAVPELEIHVSTQANVLNASAANAFYKMGARRIVLARELTIEQISDIRKNIPVDLELEAFVHGAMCVSYSGRCLLSNFFMGRDANCGNCVQACRWGYVIRETKRDNEYPIEQDEHGTYIMNSRDLCMIEYLDQLASAGVTSFKIEGRMKTEYYVANVVNAYRRAMDLLSADPSCYVCPPQLRAELDKSSHRGYSTGFYFGNGGEIELHNSSIESTHIFVAVVLSDTVDGKSRVQMRNRFKTGEVLEILSRRSFCAELTVEAVSTDGGELISDVKLVEQIVYIHTTTQLYAGDILRRKC